MVRRLGHSTTCNAFTSKWIGSAPVSKLCGTSSHFRLWLLSIHDAHVACRYNLDKNDEYCGTEIEGRNTFKNWKRSMTLEEKGDIVL